MDVHETLGTQRLLELFDGNQAESCAGLDDNAYPVSRITLNCGTYSQLSGISKIVQRTYNLRRSSEGDLSEVLRIHEV